MQKSKKNKPLVIIGGDPKSTFNEILIKTFGSKIHKKIKFPIILICSKKLLVDESKNLKKKIDFKDLNKNISILKKKNIHPRYST